MAHKAHAIYVCTDQDAHRCYLCANETLPGQAEPCRSCCIYDDNQPECQWEPKLVVEANDAT